MKQHIELRPWPGQHIDASAKIAAEIAFKFPDVKFSFWFNGTWVPIEPCDTDGVILDKWFTQRKIERGAQAQLN